MINDCKSGKIDIIITKNVSRFSRNLVDCISAVRDLAALKSPVGVYFETEHIFTLDNDLEMRLSSLAMMAQEESHIKSTSMNASIEMRFSNGILLTPAPLGYDNDENGTLIINDEEAQTVRLIFFMYLYGYSCQDIADKLTDLKLKTKQGNVRWSSSSVLRILRNERYCGDVMARKTFTPNFLDHKSRKNTGQRNRYLWRNQHDPVITRDDFIAVQHLINNAIYRNKGLLPELTIITQGILQGFILVNIHWSGFTSQNYIDTAEKYHENTDSQNQDEIKAEKGDFDLRGFEIASSHYFDNADKLYVTFSLKEITFSQTSIRKMNDLQYVEILVNPTKKLLAVRACSEKNKNAVKWAKLNGYGNYIPRIVKGSAFLGALYDLFHWNKDYKYRLPGMCFINNDHKLLIYDISQAALLFSEADFKRSAESLENTSPLLPVHGKTMMAFPESLAEHFGSSCYSVQLFEKNDTSAEQTVTISGLPELNVTDSDTVANNIQDIIQNVKGDSNG